MPDANGKIKGITVPDLPWLRPKPPRKKRDKPSTPQ